jgi:hypothetical protein
MSFNPALVLFLIAFALVTGVKCRELPNDIVALLWKRSIRYSYTITRFPLVCKSFHKATRTFSIFDFTDEVLYEAAKQAIKTHYNVKHYKLKNLIFNGGSVDEQMKLRYFVFLLHHSFTLPTFFADFEPLIPVQITAGPSLLPNYSISNDIDKQIVIYLRNHFKGDTNFMIEFLHGYEARTFRSYHSSPKIIAFIRRALSLCTSSDKTSA